MKRNFFIQLLGVFICFLYLHACSNSSAEDTIPAPAKEKGNYISFKVNGQKVETSGWNISRFDVDGKIAINVTTNMHLDKRTVAFNLRGDHTGKYSLDEFVKGDGTAYGSYRPDYSALMEAFSFKEGQIDITGIDTTKGLLNATFHGIAEEGDQRFIITDGKIQNGKLSKGVTKY